MPGDALRPRLSRGFIVAVVVILAAAATSFWYASDLRRKAAAEEDGSYIPKRVPVTDEIRLLQQYVQIDTQNPPGNETAGAKFLHRVLAKNGISAEVIEPVPGRGSVYARIKGESAAGALLLLHHIDVAPVDEQAWTQPPFSGSLARNILWGRGSLDMKGIGITHLAAFLDIAKAKRRPRHDIIFLGVADEEQGGDLGTRWLLQHRPDVFEGIGYVFSEGGITEVVRDKLTHFSVEVGSKHFISFRASAKTREPLERLRFDLAPYFKATRLESVAPQVGEYFAAIAPRRRHGGELVSDVVGAARAGKFWVLDESSRAVLSSYVVMSGIQPQAGSFEAKITLSVAVGADVLDWRERLLDAAARAGVTLDVMREVGSRAISSTRTPMFALIRAAVKEQYGGDVTVGPIVPPFTANDCRFLRSEKVHCYGFSPYLVDFFHSKGIHGHDEQLRLDWYLDGVSMMRDLVAAYAFPE